MIKYKKQKHNTEHKKKDKKIELKKSSKTLWNFEIWKKVFFSGIKEDVVRRKGRIKCRNYYCFCHSVTLFFSLFFLLFSHLYFDAFWPVGNLFCSLFLLLGTCRDFWEREREREREKLCFIHRKSKKLFFLSFLCFCFSPSLSPCCVFWYIWTYVTLWHCCHHVCWE